METQNKLQRLEELVGALKSDEKFGTLVVENYLIEAVRFYIENENPTVADFIVSILSERQVVTGSRPKPVARTLKNGEEVEKLGFTLRKEGEEFVLRTPAGKLEKYRSLTSAAQRVQTLRGLDGKVSGPRFWGLEVED